MAGMTGASRQGDRLAWLTEGEEKGGRGDPCQNFQSNFQNDSLGRKFQKFILKSDYFKRKTPDLGSVEV